MKKRISNREFEVLDQVSLGYTTDEIASNLYISTHTVITHRKSLCRKLKARNAPGLVRKAFESGVLKPKESAFFGSELTPLKTGLLTCIIAIVTVFSGISQSPMADIEGDLKIRGNIDIRHPIDSSVLIIGHKAGVSVNHLILDLQDGSGMYFPVGSTIVGGLAGQHSTGVFNCFYGYGAGQDGSFGSRNSFFGYGAGNNTTRDDNTFIGNQSGVLNTEGSDNVFVGSNTALNNTLGSYNTFVGRSAGLNNTLGSSNTFIGWNTGNSNITGHANTIIGDGADIAEGLDSLNQAIAIGFNADVGCHNCAAIGGTGEDAVKLGIGVAVPVSRLHVMQESIGPSTGLRLEVNTESDTIAGNIYLNLSNKLNFSINDDRVGYIDDVTGDYIATSDERLKRDITDLGTIIPQIMMLTPQWYRYIRNPNDSQRTLGLMAQELETYFPELVVDSEGALGVSYAKLGVVAIKGIQEQQVVIEQLLENMQELQSQVKQQIYQIEELKKRVE